MAKRTGMRDGDIEVEGIVPYMAVYQFIVRDSYRTEINELPSPARPRKQIDTLYVHNSRDFIAVLQSWPPTASYHARYNCSP